MNGNKSLLIMIVKGKKAEISDVKFIGDDHVEYKIEVKGNNQVYLIQHKIAGFNDCMLTCLEPLEEIAYFEILRDICEMNFRAFFEPSTHRNLKRNSDHTAYDAIYHDNFHMIYSGRPITKAGYKEVAAGLLD